MAENIFIGALVVLGIVVLNALIQGAPELLLVLLALGVYIKSN